MALLSISAAARAAGKDRGTIKRYIKNGKLSCSKDAMGRPVVDTSELVRVFGPLVGEGAPGVEVVTHQNTPANTTAIEALKQQLQAALEREEWLKRQLEAEQERSRELERRMLPPAQEQERAKKGFWQKLFGG